MKVWITKYALKNGILEENAEQCGVPTSGKMIVVRGRFDVYYHGKDWHKTKAKAINRAKEMQAKKIKSLEKQLEKIRGLKFD